jgi:aminodeoxyfutalosine deaminase
MSVGPSSAFPKIELHVHLEGSVRPATLLDIAERNGERLPADTVEGLAQLYRFRDFAHFIDVWIMTTHVLRTALDFRQVVVDYAAEAASHGAVYLEGIFSPWFVVQRGTSWQEVFEGYCDGAQEAYERHGVRVRLTPDIDRIVPVEAGIELVSHAARYRDRGIVAIGLGGPEQGHPPEPYAAAFAAARDGGLGSVPHAGETDSAASVRGALETLGADRIRHGIRAVDDPALLRELADRGTVLDVCPISNLRTKAVPTLEAHPLPRLAAAGIACTLATDDPAMFDTDLGREHVAAARLGVRARDLYAAGVRGALCDEDTRAELAATGAACDWDTVEAALAAAAAA